MANRFEQDDLVSAPVVSARVGIDPALAGGVIRTSVTNVTGLMAFFGLATLY